MLQNITSNIEHKPCIILELDEFRKLIEAISGGMLTVDYEFGAYLHDTELATSTNHLNLTDSYTLLSEYFGIPITSWHSDTDTDAPFVYLIYEEPNKPKVLTVSCYIGDTVYFPDENYDCVFPVQITEINISAETIQYNGCFYNSDGDVEMDFEFDTDDFQKTVFFTEAEANDTLKKA